MAHTPQQPCALAAEVEGLRRRRASEHAAMSVKKPTRRTRDGGRFLEALRRRAETTWVLRWILTAGVAVVCVLLVVGLESERHLVRNTLAQHTRYGAAGLRDPVAAGEDLTAAEVAAAFGKVAFWDGSTAQGLTAAPAVASVERLGALLFSTSPHVPLATGITCIGRAPAEGNDMQAPAVFLIAAVFPDRLDAVHVYKADQPAVARRGAILQPTLVHTGSLPAVHVAGGRVEIDLAARGALPSPTTAVRLALSAVDANRTDTVVLTASWEVEGGQQVDLTLPLRVGGGRVQTAQGLWEFAGGAFDAVVSAGEWAAPRAGGAPGRYHLVNETAVVDGASGAVVHVLADWQRVVLAAQDGPALLLRCWGRGGRTGVVFLEVGGAEAAVPSLGAEDVAAGRLVMIGGVWHWVAFSAPSGTERGASLAVAVHGLAPPHAVSNVYRVGCPAAAVGGAGRLPRLYVVSASTPPHVFDVSLAGAHRFAGVLTGGELAPPRACLAARLDLPHGTPLYHSAASPYPSAVRPQAGLAGAVGVYRTGQLCVGHPP